MKRAIAALAVFIACGLAVSAVVAGATAWLCAVAAGLGVAAWDLALLMTSAPRGAERAQEARIVRSHFAALTAGLAPGLALVALLGHARLALPLGVVLALGLLTLAALDRAWRHF